MLSLGIFVIKPGVKPMKEINLQADAMTRAAQIATGALKSKWRDQGRRFADFRISDHRKAIAELANDPRILAQATADVERFAKFRSGARKLRR